MSSYLVTGASQGLGFEFVRQLAADPANTVIGLVRKKASPEAKAKVLGLTSVHFVEAQYTDLASLKAAAESVKDITGGSLNYLINNAASVSDVTELRTLGDFHDNFDTLEDDLKYSFDVNVVGLIKTVEAFVPLIQAAKGDKKVITISSGMSDLDLINSSDLAVAAPYAISKAGVNVAVAKYNALYKSEGILFMGICPGNVATERQTRGFTDEEDKARLAALAAKFMQFAPDWKKHMTPQESATAVLSLAHKSSIESGAGGVFVSRHGNKDWM
ncbi:NAD(P)-binding protein [Aspergillus heterothallicus]